MPIQSAAMDAAVATATLDPWHGLPSLVFAAATSDEETIYEGASGYTHRPDWPSSPAELAAARKMTLHDIHDLWSASKMICVLAALQLLEQGKIDLHSDASQWVPELKTLKRLDGFNEDGSPKLVDVKNEVTVHQMITHTMGNNYETNPDYAKTMEHFGLLPPYYEDATVETVTKMPVFFEPGSKFGYGQNLEWLTLVVQNVSGLSLEAYLQQHLFAPLGITDMTYKPRREDKVGMSFSYNPKVGPNGAPIFLQDYPWCEDGQKRLGFIKEGCAFPPNHEWGGSGLFGSPASYLKILRALLRGGLAPDGTTRILKQETVDLMFQPHLNDVQRDGLYEFAGWHGDPFSIQRGGVFPGTDYGYGGLIGGEGVPSGRGKGALSWSGFAGTFWVVDRERDVAFVCWAQVIPSGGPTLMDAWELLETELYKNIEKK